MKKKMFVMIVLAVALLMTFVSCSKDNAPQKSDIYSQLNNMVKADYSRYSIAVSSELNGTTLSSTYSVVTYNNSTSVSYTYEELNPIEIVNGKPVMPADFMSVKTGSLTVKDGKITEQNGDSLNIDITKVDTPGISFDESYFDNVQITGQKFLADVIKPNESLGYSECSAVKIKVEYENSKFRTVEISYKSENGSAVKIIYSFSNK